MLQDFPVLLFNLFLISVLCAGLDAACVCCMQRLIYIPLKVGMKKEWIMMERNRRTKKRRLTTIPNTADDINRMFEEIGEGDVTVTKSVLLDLVKKSNSAS